MAMPKAWLPPKLFLVMKLTVVFLIMAFMQVYAKSYSQQINLNERNASLEKVLHSIEKQTGYVFLYTNQGIKETIVTVNVTNGSIDETLKACLNNTAIAFKIVDKNILLKLDEPSPGDKTSSSSVQPIDIHGKVTDTAGLVLPGVNVRIKGTSKGTVTDTKGEYTIKADADAVLVFSFIGYKPVEMPVQNHLEINVTLKGGVASLNDVVVVGYGTQSKATLTTAVTSIKSDEIALIPTSNLSNVLQGRLSGTFVSSGTGTPGIASAITIRAPSSWNSTGPLFVIDGVVRDATSFNALDPNEVASITVLKDAASSAIYGSRSSDGVILVTTKTGKKGKPVIQFNSIFSTDRTGELPQFMPFAAGIDLTNAVNGGISAAEKANALKINPDGRMWYNAVYKNPNTQKYALSVSGGDDFVTYYLGASYYDENGFLPQVWYNKLNLRGNIQAKLSKDLTVGLNLSNSDGDRNRFNFTYDYGSADLNNLWGKLLYFFPFTPPYINGLPVNPGWLGNPIEMMKDGGSWNNTNQQLDALVDAEYKISAVPGLSVKGSYSRNIDNSYIKNFAQQQTLYNFQTTGTNNLIWTDKVLGSQLSGDPGTPYYGNEYTKTNSYQLNAQINYDHSFGNHHISAFAGYEQYEYDSNYFSMYHNNFPLVAIDQFFATSQNPNDVTTSGNEVQNGRLSYIGRLNYDYAGKYLFSSSIRRDGSMNFAPNQRWGWFPSISTGWVISRENFFQNSNVHNFIDLLKLRFSFGSTGNDAIAGTTGPTWAWQEQYNIQSSTYYLGNPSTTAPILAYGGIPNPNLTWERSNSYDAGIDVQFLKNFTFTTEFWTKHTYDILGARVLALPVEFGGSFPEVNYGIMNAHGLEVDLAYHNKIGSDFSYAVKGNFGLAETKVIKEDVAPGTQAVNNPNGKPLGYFTGLEATGIIRTQAQLNALPTGYTINGAVPQLGMMNFKDVSGPNGVPDGKIDGYDNVVLSNHLGAANAPISYGVLINLVYKRFTLDMQFAGLAGFQNSYNDPWGRNFGGGGLVPLYHANSWSPSNPNGTTPEIFPWGDARATYVPNSSFNTFNAGFVRMKYLNFGYNLPEGLLKKLGVHTAQIFASGTNLFCLTPFKFYDPEVYQFMSYPEMKTFSLGLNVKF
ncbi:TonB-linked outer membrane protein, SusC/RagA family [Mucilaginibacter mallensis]|uniref:TonB-linked outer membrane protein, SusC/RagA family n=2 Tax=Mucilaginibacter mallensis TaxID=652787 RepID=A0A1H1RDD9_MUCMA|nr:TonB-linked outer membrane protein, SusC/RagA family [Mucilaginibacter mallensis]